MMIAPITILISPRAKSRGEPKTMPPKNTPFNPPNSLLAALFTNKISPKP